MTSKLMGKKRGMIELFDEKGNLVVGTVIEAEPNVVTQIRTLAREGYNAIQLGFDKIRVKDPRTLEKRVAKPQRGHFTKAGVEPRRHLTECRVENVENYKVGQEIGVGTFSGIDFVDATAWSIGKGYQGVMKLYGFSGGPAAHGSGFHRHAGSTGMRSTPGRCFPGGKRAGHMGHRKTTVQNLKVLLINEEDNIIVVGGSVPGPKDSLVFLCESKKKPSSKKTK